MEKVDKNWTEKKNVIEDLFPLKPLAALKTVSLGVRKTVLWYLL